MARDDVVLAKVHSTLERVAQLQEPLECQCMRRPAGLVAGQIGQRVGLLALLALDLVEDSLDPIMVDDPANKSPLMS